MKLTKQQKEDYLKHPNHCPFCKSPDIDGGPADFDDGTCTQEITCHKCGREWDDIYRLSDVACDDDEYEKVEKEPFIAGYA